MNDDRFARVIIRDFPEVENIIFNSSTNGMLEFFYNLIIEKKCSYMPLYNTNKYVYFTPVEYEWLFRRYTIELLHEHKDLIYFKFVL